MLLHTQLHVNSLSFLRVYNFFPFFFLRAKMNIFYFLNGLHHLLNHNLNLKITFHALSKFPMFSLCFY